MKKIILKKLSLINFKGAKNLCVTFNHEAYVFGANEAGKTTLFDAFTWLLFGKDSTDRKDFQIKPLDSNNKALSKTENEVEATLLVDDAEVVLKRIFREKWVKQRGASEAVFTGNETVYFWNDVPMSQKEYQAKINGMISEDIFKLITNPLAFNSLKWQDRRNVLSQIGGETKVDYTNENLENVLSLLYDKTISELKAETSSKVKKIKEEINFIPTRIDEVQKSKPTPIDYRNIENEISELEKELESVDAQLQDASNSNQEVLNKKTDLQNNIFELKSKQNLIEYDLKQQASEQTKRDISNLDKLKHKLSDKEQELKSSDIGLTNIRSKITNLLSVIDKIDIELPKVREQWAIQNAKEFVFDEENCVCTECGRKHEVDNIEKTKQNLYVRFVENNTEELNRITAKGTQLKTERENTVEELTSYRDRETKGKEHISILKTEIESLKSAIELEEKLVSDKEFKSSDEVFTELLLHNQETTKIKSEIESLTEQLNSIKPEDNSELQSKKVTLKNSIDELKHKLSTKSQIEAADARIKELTESEVKLSQSLLDIEKLQFDIERYVKLEIEALEQNINSKFKTVKFKMFETQINGGEVECCETLINGVPFSDANTASKINAGVDIINTLTEYYQVSAPIFIDNRESVSELIESKNQIINLVVSPEDKELRIVNK